MWDGRLEVGLRLGDGGEMGGRLGERNGGYDEHVCLTIIVGSREKEECPSVL